MTVAVTVRKAGPTPGNSAATVFPFAFKVFSATDLLVQLTVIASGVITDLVMNDPLGYTVALNADQNANPGGSVTYNPSGVAMPATQSLTISSAVPQAQGTHIINGGAFFANNIEDAVDKNTILIQDQATRISQAIRFPIADSAALNATLPPAAQRANQAVLFDALGNVIAGSVPNAPVAAAWLPVVQAATLPLGRAAMGFSAYFDSLIAAATKAAFTALVTPLTTKGDLWGFAAADARVPAGADNSILVADSAQANGLIWTTYPRGYKRSLTLNGAMNFDSFQEGTGGYVATNPESYTLDQYRVGGQSGATYNTSQAVDFLPAGTSFSHTLKITVTASAAVVAGDFPHIEHPIEGPRIQRLMWGSASAKTQYVYFWARATKAGSFSFTLMNGANSVFYVTTYALLANTWTFVKITVPGPTIGAWQILAPNGPNNGIGIKAIWDLGSGATFTTATTNAWTAGAMWKAAGSASLTTANDSLWITGFEIKDSPYDTEFDWLTPSDEQLLLNRYYFKTFPRGTRVGTTLGANGALNYIAQLAGVNGNGVQLRYPTEMCQDPTANTVTYNPTTNNSKWRNASGAADSGVPTLFNGGTTGVFILNPQVAGDGAGAIILIHATANARLGGP